MSWTQSVNEDERKDSIFRQWVKADGSTKFVPESNRYHLYVSLACPWAHRTLIVRRLKGLEEVLPITILDWYVEKATGWRFVNGEEHKDKPLCESDPLNKFEFLQQVYKLTDPEYSGSITVPVLFDKTLNKIVNNESSDIVRMMNKEFNQFAKRPELNLVPDELTQAVDHVNDWLHDDINNGVYKCGFALSQSAYEAAFDKLFDRLEVVENLLKTQRFLLGDVLTECDIRLFTTLIRFDTVYYVHFKCNGKRVIDYPNLHSYLCDLYHSNVPAHAFQLDANFVHIKNHFYQSHKQINPTGIVAKGPVDTSLLLHVKFARDRRHQFSNIEWSITN